MNNIVYLQDCMDGMKKYPDKYFDLAIVDPPYGINIGNKIGGGLVSAKTYHGFNDKEAPPKEFFEELERVAKHRIIWGGELFH